MGFGLIITSGDNKMPLPDEILQWLVEVRVELELSKPTRYALRFEDDICGGQPASDGAPQLDANQPIGIFAKHNNKLYCLTCGPVTDVKSSSVLGGAGSWVEIHGEDRRVEMGRVGVQATYTGKAAAAAESILSGYGFKTDVQETRINYDTNKNKLTQRGTDLAFLEDIARRNNMEFWISYDAKPKSPLGDVDLTETANFRTSPKRAQPGDVPQIPTLAPDEERLLKVNPPSGDCPTVNKFEAKIDYEKPTAAKGFAMSEDDGQSVVTQLVTHDEPLDKVRPVPLRVGNVERKIIAPPEPTADEGFLAKEALVYEQSWFVEVECSSTLEQLDFVLLPHQLVRVAYAGDRLSGGYQVMKAVHVVTATDHFVDFTLRANGMGGGG